MKYRVFAFMAVLALFSAVSGAFAQTCDCDALAAQIAALEARVAALESGAPAEAHDPAPEAEAGAVYTADGLTYTFTGTEMSKNYKGEDILTCLIDFANDSGKAQSSAFGASIKAFQNGIELDTAIILDPPSELNTEIQPGFSITTRRSFKLRDASSPVTLQIGPLFDFTGTAPVTTIEINL